MVFILRNLGGGPETTGGMQVDNEPHFKSNRNSVCFFIGIYSFAHPNMESILKRKVLKLDHQAQCFKPSFFDFKMKQLRHRRLVQGIRNNGRTRTRIQFSVGKPQVYAGFLLAMVLKEPSLLHPQNAVSTQQTGLFSRRLSVLETVSNNTKG